MQHDADQHRNSGEPPALPCPDELKDLPQWVLWRVLDDDRKVPFNAHTHHPARYTDPAAWSSFADACAAFHAKPGRYRGLGFVFSPHDPYTGIDLDDCVHDGTIVVPEAAAIVAALDTYTEISPSGTGVKLWVRGAIPRGFNRPLAGTSRIEMYDRVRFFTVTGRRYPGTPLHIRDAHDDLATLYETYGPSAHHEASAERTAQNAEQEAMDAHEPPSLPGDAHEPPSLPGTTEWEQKRRYALAALHSERLLMLAAVPGERHTVRLRAAYALAGYIPYITEQEIVDAIAVNFGPSVANAMRTIRDGITLGRAAPRPIRLRSLLAPALSHHATPPEDPGDADRSLSHEQALAEVARLRHDLAALEQRTDDLEREHRWRVALNALPTATLSPAAKVVAQVLRPEVEYRKRNHLTGAWGIWIAVMCKKAGLSADVFGAKLKELEAVGALRRRLVADAGNGHSRVEIEALAFDEPERWERAEPRNHGGVRQRAEAAATLPVCESCTPGTPILTTVETTHYCEGCGAALVEPTVRKRRHRPNPQFDGLEKTEADPQPRKLPVGPPLDDAPPPSSPPRDPRSMIARVRPRKHPPP
jgi:hypothetical protein